MKRFLKQFLEKNLPPQQPAPPPANPEVCEQAARGFEDVYRNHRPEQMPWFWAGLDPDFSQALADYSVTPGTVVDLGGGSGTQAIALAKLGFTATCTDFSTGALEGGRKLAQEANVRVDFRYDDVTNTHLKEPFDLVLDRGCFHIIAPARRRDYLQTVLQCLAPQGWFFFKCFSALEPPRPGPFCFTEAQIRDFFEPSLEILELRDTEFPGSRAVFPKAIFAVMKRRSGDFGSVPIT